MAIIRNNSGNSNNSNNSNEGIIARISKSVSESSIVYQGKRAVSDAAYVTKKLLKSTGKAAWIVGTTFLVLAVPLVIEMDREQQMAALDMEQASLLGAPPVAPSSA